METSTGAKERKRKDVSEDTKRESSGENKATIDNKNQVTNKEDTFSVTTG